MDKKISIRITREQYDWLVSRGNPSMVIRSIVSDKMSDKVVSPQDKSVVSDNSLSDKVVLSDKILSDKVVSPQDKRKKRVKVSDKVVSPQDKKKDKLFDEDHPVDILFEHQEQCGGILPAYGMSIEEFMQHPAAARSQWGLTGGHKANGVFKVWFEKSSWKY